MDSVGWLENQNVGKPFALRLYLCLDDEKTSQAKFHDNLRLFRVSADHLKFKHMKKVIFLDFFSCSIFFNSSMFWIFSLKFIPNHNIMNNVVSEFQRILLMYRGSAMPNCVIFPNYSVLKLFFFVYFCSCYFFFVFPRDYTTCHHELDFYKFSIQSTDIYWFRGTVNCVFSNSKLM